MKKVLIAVMVVVLFVTSVMFAADQLVQAKLANIRVLLNGSPIELKDATGAMVKPLSYKDTTYLPVRAISENLGLTVGWDEATQTVSLTTSSDSDKNQIKKDIDPANIDHGKPFLRDDKGIEYYKKLIGEEVKFHTMNFKVNSAYEANDYKDGGYYFQNIDPAFKLVVTNISVTNTTNKSMTVRGNYYIGGNGINTFYGYVTDQRNAPSNVLGKIVEPNHTISGDLLLIVPIEATEYYYQLGIMNTNKQFRFYLAQ